MRRAVLLPLLATSILAGNPTVVNNGAICENKATGFFVMDNMALTTTNSIVYKDYSEDECLKTCAQNRDQLGRSILCSSFAYHHESFSCTIYKDKKEPEGQAEKVMTIGKRYFEKVCLNEDVPVHCADAQFLRVDNFELVGYAVEVAVTETLEECLAHCAKNTTCKSALYFYEENECILNTESALSKPDDFKKAQDDDKVIYFQNACAAPRVQIEPTTPASATKSKGSSEREGSADESSSEKTIAETAQSSTEDEEVTTPIKTTTTEEPAHEEDDETDHEADHELEKVDGGHEAATTDGTDDAEYDEDKSIEQEEEIEKEKERVEKLAQKASYIKYKQHPRNFASRTLKASDDEAVVDPVDGEHTASHQEEEQEDIEQISKEEGDEPIEGQTKPIHKKSKHGKKVPKADSSETLVEEPFVNYFSEWSDWTPCTQSGERQIRRRKCLDLRKCLGALMQVRNCPAVIPTPAPEGPIESVRSLVAVPPVDYDDTVIRSPVSVVRPHPETSLPAAELSTPEAVWSPWQETCQQFASGQPCNDGQMIGFESRECVAKDPSYCEGPFFRYCTLAC